MELKSYMDGTSILFNHQRNSSVGNVDINHWWNYKQTFCQLYVTFTNENPDRMMPTIFFVWHVFFVCKSIDGYITDGITNRT
jgi:hypothetical protein